MGGEFWITIVFLLLVGALAAAGMIAARQPNAGAAINKLVPFQGIIGIVALAWGIWSLIQALTGGVMAAFSFVPVTVLLALGACVLLILLGFLFGWGLINRVTGGGGQGAAVAQKLAGIQGPLGLLTIGVAVAIVILTLFKIAI